MNISRPKPRRILGIDPMHRGFGFVLLETPAQLIDWGVKYAKGDLNGGSVGRVANLIDAYAPDLLVIEDITAPGSRRRRRMQKVIAGILAAARQRHVRTCRIPRRLVHKVFGEHGARAIHEIATVIARRFPELDSRIPPPRKATSHDDDRARIFGAAAFAITYLEKRKPRSSSYLEASIHEEPSIGY